MFACLLLAASVGMASAAGKGSTYSYPESEANGWTDTCVTGDRQSPIDLDSSMKAQVHAPINFRNYFNGHFNKFFKGSLKNTGTSVQWNINHLDDTKLYGGAMWKWKNPSIRDGPYGGKTYTHAYYLWQLHFHWGEPGNSMQGSEHTVDGNMYPLEMHMVHIEDKFVSAKGVVDAAAATSHKHGVAVLGIFFHVDPAKPQNQEPLSAIDDKVWEIHWPGAASGAKRSAKRNPLFDPEMDLEDVEEKQMEHDHSLNMRSLSYGFSKLGKLNKEVEKREPHTDKMKLTLNIGAFIRKAVRNGKENVMSTYWTYKGSLTTPGCAEAVTWVVFERSLPIAQVQVNSFASLYCNNYRESRNATAMHEVQYLIHDCLACNCKC